MKPEHIPPGTPIVVDGDRPATVRSSYPEGSTSYAFPHVRYDSAGGEEDSVVSSRVELAGSGDGKVARVELDRHAADPWVGSRKGRPIAVRKRRIDGTREVE